MWEVLIYFLCNFKADLCKMTQSYLGHNILSGSWSTIISALLNGTMVFDGITGMIVGSHPYPSGIPTKFPSGIPPLSQWDPTSSRWDPDQISQWDPTLIPVGSHWDEGGIPPFSRWDPTPSHWDPDQISQWDWWYPTGIPPSSQWDSQSYFL